MSGKRIVLIVDDSAIDRRLAGALVKKADFEPVFAADGREALAEIARQMPAILVTDLHMPNMNGLELTEAVRKAHPWLPVVLMTAHGSEEIAMLALRTGAASFVPKRRLADDLATTLHAILELSQEAQERTSALDPLETVETRFEIESDPKCLPDVVGQLEAEISRLGWWDETGVLQIGVALREAIVNAIFHGNLEVSSDLLEGGGAAFAALAAQRRLEAPYKDRKVHVVARYTEDRVTYRVTDEGPGFDPRSLPDPTDLANLERVHGRGLMLIRMFMDSVEHNAEGNEVRMTKLRHPFETTH